ncbi:hypothetical protein UlMin_045529 [Ulmus minor]
MKMAMAEEEEEYDQGVVVCDASIGTHWWWATGSAAQLGWGIFSFKRGYSGQCNLMPLRAFGVASLFVGAGASASIAALKASGIHKVEDLMEVGANIRNALGVRPRRARDE